MISKKIDEDVINFVHQSFSFLENDCGYVRSENYLPGPVLYTRNNYVFTYTSLKNKKQIEIALLIPNQNVEIYIRNFIGNGPAPYNDATFCISYLLLLFLLNPPEPDRITYSHSTEARLKVLNDAAELFYHFKHFFCSEAWFDMEKIRTTENEYYLKKWGSQKKNISKSIYSTIKEQLNFLLENNYELLYDSDEMPPYAVDFWFITYTNKINTITVSQSLPQDGFYYMININGKKQEIHYKNAFDENVPTRIADILRGLV